MIDQLTREDFSDLPAGALRIAHPAGPLALDVRELRDLPPTSPRPAPFAVVLAGPASPLLEQGIHPLLHPTHGRLDLFLVPVARDAAGMRYEIVFN